MKEKPVEVDTIKGFSLPYIVDKQLVLKFLRKIYSLKHTITRRKAHSRRGSCLSGGLRTNSNLSTIKAEIVY